jgi:hypothetical protein
MANPESNNNADNNPESKEEMYRKARQIYGESFDKLSPSEKDFAVLKMQVAMMSNIADKAEEATKRQAEKAKQAEKKSRGTLDGIDPEDIEWTRKVYGEEFDRASVIEKKWLIAKALLKRINDMDKEEPKKQTKKESEKKSFWRKLSGSSIDDNASSVGLYAKQCYSCFTKNPQNSQFCNKCGKKLY